jgi:DNA-binding response OmpR family regulator
VQILLFGAEVASRNPSIEILITDMPGLSGTKLGQRAPSFRDQLHVILLSGRESGSHEYPLIREPILLQRVWQN